jgi:hypothetical protein
MPMAICIGAVHKLCFDEEAKSSVGNGVEWTYLCTIALTRSNRVASVEIIVVILPTECSTLALLESRSDLRKMVDTIPGVYAR